MAPDMDSIPGFKRVIPSRKAGERLLKAAEKGNVAEARRLLDAGADVEYNNLPAYMRALHYAVFHNRTRMVALLLGRGASATARQGMGGTPLHAISLNTTTAIAEMLLAAGAELDARAANGQTPLHYAARIKNPFIAQFLLERGADENAADNSGNTPLHFAANGKHREAALCLLLHGANPDAKNRNDETPLAKWPEMATLVREAEELRRTAPARAIRTLHARVKGLRPPAPSL